MNKPVFPGIDPGTGGMTADAAPDTAPENLAGLLREHGVHVSQRGPRLRVSAHVYNDEDDIALFANTLRALLK